MPTDKPSDAYPIAIYDDLATASSALDEPVVTIGNFDGVHVGHQTIFEHARELADRHQTSAVALTFEPHPVRFFKPDAPPFRLTTLRQKVDLMDRFGLHGVVALSFGQQLANLTPEKFVRRIIAEGIGARHVIVGANFRFGKKRAGSTDDLERLCREHGIETTIWPEVEQDGEVVSSTRIRDMLSAGNLETVEGLLGHPYRIAGVVVHGDKRGRQLGYPTANIDPDNDLLPPDGIYATRLETDQSGPMPAATSIGVRPTFEGSKRVVEAYVLDRDDLDLYDEHVELSFYSFLRQELRFESADELVAQMADDVEEIRSFFDSRG